MNEVDHFKWLVDARRDNQALLLRLYRFGQSVPDLKDDKIGRQLYAYLVGAGFSLWRAAFLSDSTREWADILQGDHSAVKLLEKVLRDNAINYPQDRDTRDWMGGYYLNSARLRLVRARQRLRDLVPRSSDLPRLRLLDQLDADGIEGRNATECWQILHDAAVETIDELEKALAPV